MARYINFEHDTPYSRILARAVSATNLGALAFHDGVQIPVGQNIEGISINNKPVHFVDPSLPDRLGGSTLAAQDGSIEDCVSFAARLTGKDMGRVNSSGIHGSLYIRTDAVPEGENGKLVVIGEMLPPDESHAKEYWSTKHVLVRELIGTEQGDKKLSTYFHRMISPNPKVGLLPVAMSLLPAAKDIYRVGEHRTARFELDLDR